jgi:DNA invertase Pin-like site-specific DNA recombinase
MRIAYARVSTEKQYLDRQLVALERHGYDKIITEKYTGTRKDREGINKLKDIVRKGDTVIVESISRLGRKTLDILTLIEELTTRGVTFISLKESMDTSTPTGKAILQMMATISELERNLLVERVKEGMEATKKRGTKIGRPRVDNRKVHTALKMYNSGDYTVKEIIEQVGISQGSLYRAIDKQKLKGITKQRESSK